MQKLILFLLLFLNWAVRIVAQPAGSSSSDAYPPLYFEHLTRNSGLPSDVVLCAIQDFQGYIWIGTTNGLARYDGHDMKVFRSIPGDSTSLVDNSIYDLYQTRDSMIWIGTGNGLSICNPNSGTLRNFPFDEKKGGIFPAGRINSFFEDEHGDVWIATGDGLIRSGRNGNHFAHIQISNSDNPQSRAFNLNLVSCILPDPRSPDLLLLGTMGGLVRFNIKNNTVDRDYAGPHPKYNMIRRMLVDSGHRLWVCGWGFGLGCFYLNSETWQVFKPGLKKISILSMIPKNQEEIWLATDGMGLGVFKKKTKRFFFYQNDPRNPKSLSSDIIHGGAWFNKHQDFWVWGNGVDIENREYFSFQQVKVPYKFWWISDFFKDESAGKLFIGTYNCNGLPLQDLKNNSWSLIPCEKPFAPEGFSVNQFYQDSQKRLWVSSRSNLRYFDRQANLIRIFRTADGKPLQLTDQVIYGLKEDHGGNLWIGTRYDGVICLDKSRKRTDYYKHIAGDQHSLIEGTHFLGIQTDKFNRIWLGCRNGVSIFDPVEKTFFNSLMDTLQKYGIKKRWVNGLEKDSLGRMWLAIDGTGLVRLEFPTQTSFVVKLFHAGNGMNDPGTGWIARDQDAGFWVINNGLLYVDPYHDRFQIIDNQNGLHENPGGSAGTYIDREGNIYIGDSVGYETKNMKAICYTEKTTLKLVLESVEINGKTSTESISSRMPVNLNLTADQNNLTFHYTAICFHHTGQIRYRYKLQGYDAAWVSAESSREARYTNLSPGKYSFYVSASEGEGWLNSRESIDIIIHPFFWQTWWFILSCILVLSASFVFIYRYRVRQLLKVERLRTRIATDLHDDVSSTLSSISILSDIVGRQTGNPKSVDMIREIGSSAHEMLERIDDIIWSVTPANDKFQDLGLRIREYAIPLFESKNIQFHFEIPEKLAGMRLQMETRRNIYLIAKEAINNLVKYAQCKNVHVGFSEESGLLVMEIRDDGVGFDPGAPTSRNGIRNMRIRAEKIGGIITLRSQPGNETQICLKVKII